MSRYFLIISAIILSSLSFSDAGAMSLNEALVVAYKNNPQLKAERENLKAVDERMAQAISGWLPSLTATYNSEKEKEKFGATARETTNYPKTKSLNLIQPIFNGGGSIAKVKQAMNQVSAGREKLKGVEQKILSDAIAAYIDIVRTKEVLELSKNNENVLKEQLEATQSQFKLGEATVTDVSQSESRLAVAESDRIKAEGLYIEARSDFRRIYEIEPPEGMTIPVILPELPKTQSDVLSAALEGSPALKLAEYNAAAAESDIWISKSSILPTVNLVGSMERQEGLSSSRGREITSDTIGLNVRIPLYQSGAEYSRVREAKKIFERENYSKKNAYNETVDEATKVWSELETNRASIKAAQANVDSAKIALDGVKEEQQVGSRTVLDVLDAEQEFFQAQVRLVTTKRNEVVSVYGVLNSMGKLTAKDLALNTEIYDPAENYNRIKYQIIGF